MPFIAPLKMKNILTLTLIIVIFFQFGCQKTNVYVFKNYKKDVQLVSLDSAIEVALRFNASVFFNSSNPSNHSPFKSTLNGNNKIADYTTIKDSKGRPAIYIFNFSNNNGFLFVSADYQLQPVLAFIERGKFTKDTVPPGIITWVNKTMSDIEIVREGLYDNSAVAKAAWALYRKENFNSTAAAKEVTPNSVPVDPNICESNPNYNNTTTEIAGPLLATTWGQGCSYNNLCPPKGCNDCSPNAVTGCVATAMAQVIRYWHPNTSYAYNYAIMPAATGNSEVQRLMINAGVAVFMNYGCAANGGSAADGGIVPNVLKNSFGFVSASRSSYGANSQLVIENDIRYAKPVLLEGCNEQTNRFLGVWYTYQNCHEWVCDGFRETLNTYCANGNLVTLSTLYFHMNWGWHEVNSTNDYNGWFISNNWTIAGINRNYQYARSFTSSIRS